MYVPVEWMRAAGIHPQGVLHIGAHEAEELAAYSAAGWGPRTWVEALPDLAEALSRRLSASTDDAVVTGAVWERAGETLEMHRANNGMSSSLLAPNLHLKYYKSILFTESASVQTIRLADALEQHRLRFGKTSGPDFIYLDIQGSELHALQGLNDSMGIKYIYSEVSTKPLYANQALRHELDSFLGHHGFRRVATVTLPRVGWGDALYAHTAAWDELSAIRRTQLTGRAHLASAYGRIAFGTRWMVKRVRRTKRSLRTTVSELRALFKTL